ncbi:MAG: oligosaccharide flippase family protein [Bacteroidetes bacterium]|nr:oligosaccharide flippase family protein [Bacteroidota bacterium]
MSLNKNIFYSFLTQIPTLILGIVSGVFITRILGAEGKGVYAIIQSDCELFSLVFSFSITGGMVYFISLNKISINKLLGLGVFILLIGAFLSASILVISKLYFSTSLIFPRNYNSWFYVIYVFAAFCFSLFNSFISAIFQGKSLFKYVNTVSLLNSIFNLSFFTFAFLYHYYISPIGFKSVLGLALIVFILNAVMWIYFFKKHIDILPSFNISLKYDVKPLLKFVAYDHIGHIINFLNYRLDIWIINNYVKDLKQLGYYNVAVTTAQMVWLITTPIASVLIPYLVKSGDDEKNKIFPFFSRFNFTASLLIVVISVILAPVLLPLIYGAEFVNSVPLFMALTGGVLFYSVSKIFATYIYCSGKIEFNLMVAAIGLFFTILMNLILIPKIGVLGASIASSLSYFCMFISTSYFVFNRVNLPFASYFLLNKGDIKAISQKAKGMLEAMRKAD